MERVKINLPEKVLFTYTFTIATADINEAQHMGNERILVFTNIVRTAFFKALDFNTYETAASGTIVANHSIHYKSEGFAGDVITCEVGAQNLTDCSFDIVFHFIKENGKTLATVRTGCVYYDYVQRKILALPAHYVAVMS